MATWKSVGNIFTCTIPTLSPEPLSTKGDPLKGIVPHKERRAGAPSSGYLQPLLLRTLTVFTDAELS